MKTYSFENLEVWKKSRELVFYVYQIQSSFPPYEKYGLGDQLRRAVVSVSSNIAEGNARYSVKEQAHFIEIAIGSLMEVYCQIVLAYDLKYITEEQLNKCNERIEIVFKLLNGLRYQKLKLLSTSTSNKSLMIPKTPAFS
ncbi:MAG: four helix bundle protein [Bacteroidales bacterium]|nr:four helix bundle protein [Bacteroidales bacterium]